MGQGTQDIGFRNEMSVLFNALPALPLRLAVRDENGAATVAAFTIRFFKARVRSRTERFVRTAWNEISPRLRAKIPTRGSFN